MPIVIVDGPVSTATGVAVQSQFALTTQQKLNGIIDVYQDRKAFFDPEIVCPGGNATAAPACAPTPALTPFTQNDTLNFSTFTLGNPIPALWSAPTVTPTAAVITITGDFSWVDGADTNSTCDAGEFAAALQGFGGWTVGSTSNCQQAVLNQDTPIVDAVTTGYFRVPGNKTLSATDFVGNVEWTYGLTASPATVGKTALAWDPGAWTINGAQVYIQYMPYGDGLSRIIYAANDGVLNPEVTADITANGTTFSCALGIAPAKTVTSLSGVIDTCVAAAGITSGKVAILLTFIAPDVDIEVYSAYNAGGTDRGTVVNTSNGRSFFYGTGVTFP